MKKIINVSIVMIAIALTACIGYGFYKYGIPYIDAKTKHTINAPTIDSLSKLNVRYAYVIDSLHNVIEFNDSVIASQESIITILKDQMSKYGTLNKMNRNIYNKLNEVESKLNEHTK